LLLSFTAAAQAQAPIAGQPYQVPAGYEAYGAGTVITYAGYNYVIQGNGTMLLNADSQPSPAGTTAAQGPAAGQPYQVPAGYEAYSAGTVITHAGYNYVIQGNGTMLLNADSQPSYGGTTVAQGPAAGQPYQVPAGYESYGPGTLISYAGYNYVIQGNGTMILASNSQASVPYQTYQQTQYTYQQPQNAFQQPQYAYQQTQYTYQQPQSYYQQPQYTYEQPQTYYQQPQYSYQQPQYTYQQSQNYYQPGTYFGATGGGMFAFGGAGVTGGGGHTLGGSNVAVGFDRYGNRYSQTFPRPGGQTAGGIGPMRGPWRGR
jgi:hypothetical protein